MCVLSAHVSSLAGRETTILKASFQDYRPEGIPMKISSDNIWDAHGKGAWACITTNGIIKKDGMAVMGAGIAKQAASRYPDLPIKLADNLKRYGNRVFVYPSMKLITFPTKNNWRDNSDIELIKISCIQLVEVMVKFKIDNLWLPRPGCNNGKLEWEDVRKIIEPLLNNNITVCGRDEKSLHKEVLNMEMTFDKIARQKQKEFLRTQYKDYDAKHHDVFVMKYNKEVDKSALQTYMKNRGIEH